jgi:chaperonin GroES
VAKAKKKTKKIVKVAKKTKPKSAKANLKKVVKAKAKTQPNKSQPKKAIVAKQKLVDISQFITPLDDRIVIQVLSQEKVTPGGIIIPDTVTSEVGHHKAQVLAVGRGHRDSKGRLRPMDVKVGDQVFVQTHSGSKIKFNNTDLIILRETEVMGVVG